MRSLTENDILFLDYCQPALAAGRYTIAVRQTLSDKGEIGKLNQEFHVCSPQFSLDPKDIHTHYPAQGAVDDYNAQLPYIVLTKRTLPWERKLSGPGDDPIPWIALLVFTEDEISPTFTMTIEEYLEPERNAGEAAVRAVVPLNDDHVDSMVDRKNYCQCIELAIDMFKAVAPSLCELPYLAHCRHVDMTQKVEVDMPHQGDFSVVMANRLPVSAKRNVVHLVSLQGCESYLSGGNKSIESKDIIRLISLAHWSFQCSNGDDSFEAIVDNLLKMSGHEHRLLRLPTTPITEAAVRNRLEEGYVPLPFHLMNGRDSFAWYRGPLAPVRAGGPSHSKAPSWSASSALAFDAATGVFDQTYAAAWQLGRLLALADRSFGLKLLELRRKIHHELDRFFERFVVAVETGQPFAETDMETLVQEIMEFDPLDRFEQAIRADHEQIVENLRREFDDSETLSDPTEDVDALFEEPGFDKYMDQFEDFLKNISNDENATGESGADDSVMAAAQEIDYKKFVSHLLSRFAIELKAIAEWLNQLSLKDIPVYYTLPHPQLLPMESLRFFHVDESWWHALYDGALSLGIHSRIDETLGHMLRTHFLDSENRKNIAGLAAVPLHVNAGQWGLLLRSKLVKAWSSVEFDAYLNNESIDSIITEKIGNDTVLILFNERPDRLQIQTPREGLRFSVNNRCVNVKQIQGDEAGKTVDSLKVDVLFRGKDGVIDIKNLVAQLDAKLSGGGGESVKSAAFALQLIDQPDRFVLKLR